MSSGLEGHHVHVAMDAGEHVRGILQKHDETGITILLEGHGQKGQNVWFPVHRIVRITDEGYRHGF